MEIEISPTIDYALGPISIDLLKIIRTSTTNPPAIPVR